MIAFHIQPQIIYLHFVYVEKEILLYVVISSGNPLSSQSATDGSGVV